MKAALHLLLNLLDRNSLLIRCNEAPSGGRGVDIYLRSSSLGARAILIIEVFHFCSRPEFSY